MGKSMIKSYSICTLSPTSNDLIADYFEHYLDVHSNLHFPHRHSFYHLVYFTHGTGKHSIDFINYEVEPGQIYFMKPGQVHSWNFEGKPKGFIVNFSESYLAPLIANARYLDRFSFFTVLGDAQVIQLAAEKRTTIPHLLKRIVEESQSDNLLKDDIIRLLLLQLFIEVERAAGSKVADINNHNSLIINNFYQLIEGNYKSKKLTKEYAVLLYVTPNYLNALCKSTTGKPAGELIRDRVILEAKRLLINADVTIAEIALELDFADNSYFSKFFKKYTGYTPENFRKQFMNS